MILKIILSLFVILLASGCESGREAAKDNDHNSALENYIDEPRERARDVKKESEEQDEKTKQELDKILE